MEERAELGHFLRFFVSLQALLLERAADSRNASVLLGQVLRGELTADDFVQHLTEHHLPLSDPQGLASILTWYLERSSPFPPTDLVVIDAIPAASSHSEDPDRAEKIERIQQLQEQLRTSCLCCVCTANLRSEILPCGHMSCRPCRAQLASCPLCRSPITSSQTTFS
eukprot:m.68221 g.68221  ORF g.68221 m.68221 type:complete len:167 (-) comp50009_c0_seq2:312-812(-)